MVSWALATTTDLQRHDVGLGRGLQLKAKGSTKHSEPGKGVLTLFPQPPTKGGDLLLLIGTEWKMRTMWGLHLCLHTLPENSHPQ